MNNDYPGRESKLLEFKSKVPHFLALIKTCTAFANASGGRIIIGVDDETRQIMGVSDEDRIKIYDDFPNSLYDTTQPSLIAQIYEQSFDKETVLIIEIPISPRKPYFLKQKGVENGTYIRVGSSTRKANQECIEDLMREAERVSYDETIVSVPTEVLSKELLRQFFQSTVTKKRLLSEKIIALKPANKEKYAPTVAGILMFSESPDHYIPEALIKISQFKGTKGRDIIRRADISGSIEEQSAQSVKLIENWLSMHYTLEISRLSGRMIIPPEAIREAIMNALLHRKYSIPGSIKIAVYDDRLEIFSPGCFPGLVNINNLGDGTTYLRNPALVRLAYKMNLIETRGTGIRLIMESCKKAGIQQPTYHEEGDFVKVVFHFAPDLSQHDTEEKAIISFLEMNREITAAQVAEYLGVSHNTAIRKLKNLIDLKKVRKLGKARASRYQLQ